MKDKIKVVATQMLITHGTAGFRFQQIAEELNCTRANVHYHYRHKHQLIEEVTVEYCKKTIEYFDQIWLSEDSLSNKIQRSLQFHRLRYLAFNPTGDTGNPWSLIARMRLEKDLITSVAREAVSSYTKELQRSVFKGMHQAVSRGELVENAPVETISLLLVEMANSADPITRDASNFERLQMMYEAFERLLKDAYGKNYISA